VPVREEKQGEAEKPQAVILFFDVLTRGGYSHIHAIWVCAAVKGMVFKLFSLG